MRADAEQNRQALIQAAWELFAEQGPDVSLRTVSQRAGVGIATLYRHFPSRDDLLFGLIQEARGRVSGVLQRQEALWDSDPEKAWGDTVHQLAALEIGALAFQIGPLTASSPELVARIEEVRRSNLRTLDSMVQRAQRAGLVGEGVSGGQVFAGLAAVTRPMPAEVRQFLPDHRDWLVDTFLRGLRPT